MKILKALLLASAAAAASAPIAWGSVILSDDFSGYSNGNLVGQGSWSQTSTAATPAVQVLNENVILGTGQDVYKAFASPVPLSTVGTLYLALDFSISAVGATGDYFFHVTPTVGDSTTFYARLFVKSSGSGFVVGLTDTSGTNSAYDFGSQVLALNTQYKAVIAWTSVAGTTNDTFKVYIDPVSATEASNTAYLSHTWTSASPEPTAIAALNLRQGGTNTAPTATVYDVIAATTFAEAAGISQVPEPGTYAAIVGIVALGGVLAVRRRRV